jgi:hypothetical protein
LRTRADRGNGKNQQQRPERQQRPTATHESTHPRMQRRMRPHRGSRRPIPALRRLPRSSRSKPRGRFSTWRVNKQAAIRPAISGVRQAERRELRVAPEPSDRLNPQKEALKHTPLEDKSHSHVRPPLLRNYPNDRAKVAQCGPLPGPPGQSDGVRATGPTHAPRVKRNAVRVKTRRRAS